MLRAAEKGSCMQADGTWGPVKPPGATGLLPGTPSLLASWAGRRDASKPGGCYSRRPPGRSHPAHTKAAILPRLWPPRGNVIALQCWPRSCKQNAINL